MRGLYPTQVLAWLARYLWQMREDKVIAQCPICSTECSRVIREFHSSDVENAFVPATAHNERFAKLRAHTEYLWESDKARIVACDQCSFAFSDPFVAGDATFYELSSFDTPYPKDKWEFRHTLAALTNLPNRASLSALEIGAGKGYFLQHLINAGFSRDKLVAFEFSSAGREAIRKMNVQCCGDDIRDSIELQDRRFDLVFMFQVLEHLDNYQGLFRRIEAVTHPRSKMFISVPNGERMNQNELHGLLLDSPPNHISRWSAQSLAKIAEKHGWNVCQLAGEPTSRANDIAFAMINRFLRKSQSAGSWANFVSNLAERQQTNKQKRLVKMAGAFTTPAAYAAAVKAALWKRVGHTLWVELQRA